MIASPIKANDLPGRDTVDASANRLYAAHANSIYVPTDRMFAVLLGAEWIAAIILACVLSPWTWDGAHSQIHPHVLMAIFGGALLASFPIVLAWARPGRLSTRMVTSASQLLFSSLLIHLSGGRIETHFHIFGSLAFVAAYRDSGPLCYRRP